MEPESTAAAQEVPNSPVEVQTAIHENQKTVEIGNSKKKRKVAVYIAYVGHGYQGMQRNPGARTIEDELFSAFHKAGGISDANASDGGFSKIHWMRAARTDKGVSAICQVVSLMMVIQPNMVERINEHLPPAIRILGINRVVKGFDARQACDRRRYEYIFPAWVFDPEVTSIRTDVGATEEGPAEDGNTNEVGTLTEGDEFAARRNSSSIQTQLTEGSGNFVFDQECADKMTAILQQYKGTHNFHNFTIRVSPSAPQANRYILSFTCTGAFDIGGKQWVRMVVVGQSFMLHQIRKMVGMALAEYKGLAPHGCLQYALKAPYRVVVPMAPDLGLFLDECYYEAYSRQWGGLHGELSAEPYQEQIDEFKATQLYPKIAQRDDEEDVNRSWLKTVNEAYYKFQDWLTTDPKDVVNKRALPPNGEHSTEQKKASKKPKVPILKDHFNAEYSD